MKKRNIIRLIAISVTLVLLVGAAPALAVSHVLEESVYTQPTESEVEAEIEGEVTEWYFRNNNGICEKRLWSVTYGKWLTAWMPV